MKKYKEKQIRDRDFRSITFVQKNIATTNCKNRRSLGHLAGSAVLFTVWALGLASNPASASVVQTQSWSADWVSRLYVPDGSGGTTEIVTPGNASGNGSGGSLTVSASPPGSSFVTGEMSLDFDTTTGRLRSGNDIDSYVYSTGTSDNEVIGDFIFESSNQVNFTDTLSVGAGNWGELKVTIKVNGSLLHNARIETDPNSTAGNMELNNDITINATLGADSGSSAKHIDSKLSGAFGPNPGLSKSDNATLNDEFTLVVPFSSGFAGVDFTFSYLEELTQEVEWLDAEYAEFSSINNFGHTLDLFASVYDQNGQLMDGVAVTSSLGITYQSLTQSSAVPLPVSWLLFGIGMAGLSLQQRIRKRS